MAKATGEQHKNHNIGKVVENAAWAIVAMYAGAIALDAFDVGFSL